MLGVNATKLMIHMYLDMWVSVQAAAGTIDYIIDTVSASHPLDPYLSTLKLDGKLVMVEIPEKPLSIHALTLTSGKAPNSSFLFVCLFVGEQLFSEKFIGREGKRCVLKFPIFLPI